jgi:hypothetical protein
MGKPPLEIVAYSSRRFVTFRLKQNNTFSAEIQSVYPSAYRISLERKKSIGRKAKDANQGFEYLIVLDPKGRRDDWLSLGPIERRKRYSPKYRERDVDDLRITNYE